MAMPFDFVESADLQAEYEYQQNCDVSIEVDERFQFKAHFRVIIDRSFLLGFGIVNKTLSFTNENPDLVRLLFDCMYTGHYSPVKNDYYGSLGSDAAVYGIADRYQVCQTMRIASQEFHRSVYYGPFTGNEAYIFDFVNSIWIAHTEIGERDGYIRRMILSALFEFGCFQWLSEDDREDLLGYARRIPRLRDDLIQGILWQWGREFCTRAQSMLFIPSASD